MPDSAEIIKHSCFCSIPPQGAEAVVRVSDGALIGAMRLLLTRMKILVEPTGALPAAAALEGLLPDGMERVGVILSGGNVDPATLADLLAR